MSSFFFFYNPMYTLDLDMVIWFAWTSCFFEIVYGDGSPWKKTATKDPILKKLRRNVDATEKRGQCTDSINLEAQDQHPDKIVIPKKIEQHFITVLVGFWLSIFLGLPRINGCLACFPSQIVFSLISLVNSILMDTELCLDPLSPIFHGERRSFLEIPN